MNNFPKFSLYFLGFFGISMLFKAVVIFYDEHQNLNNNWIKTEATIKELKTKWTEIQYIEKNQDTTIILPTQKLHFLYSYQFNNKYYHSSNTGIDFSQLRVPDLNNEIVEKLSNKKKIYVYVNPKEPKNSCIVKNDINYSKLGLGIGLFGGFLFILFLVIFNLKYKATHIADKIEVL